jgi:hypothetical protein
MLNSMLRKGMQKLGFISRRGTGGFFKYDHIQLKPAKSLTDDDDEPTMPDASDVVTKSYATLESTATNAGRTPLTGEVVGN